MAVSFFPQLYFLNCLRFDTHTRIWKYKRLQQLFDNPFQLKHPMDFERVQRYIAVSFGKGQQYLPFHLHSNPMFVRFPAWCRILLKSISVMIQYQSEQAFQRL